MPDAPPYLPSVKNIPAILDKIRTAGTPPRFTHEFLKANLGFPSSNDRGMITVLKRLGFPSSNDRGMITVLKRLGFLSADAVPTQRYNDYRDASKGSAALAAGLREGFEGDRRRGSRATPEHLALDRGSSLPR